MFTIDDYRQAEQIEQHYFPTDCICDAHTCYNWYQKNPHTMQALFDNDGTMIGFINALPVSEQTYQQFYQGTFKDTDLPIENLLQYKDNTTYKLYFCSIAIHPDYRGKGCIKPLAAIWINSLINLYQTRNIKFDIIFGEAITEKGEKFLKSLKLQKHKHSDHSSLLLIKHMSQNKYETELKFLKRLFR